YRRDAVSDDKPMVSFGRHHDHRSTSPQPTSALPRPWAPSHVRRQAAHRGGGVSERGQTVSIPPALDEARPPLGDTRALAGAEGRLGNPLLLGSVVPGCDEVVS